MPRGDTEDPAGQDPEEIPPFPLCRGDWKGPRRGSPQRPTDAAAHDLHGAQKRRGPAPRMERRGFQESAASCPPEGNVGPEDREFRQDGTAVRPGGTLRDRESTRL